MSHLTTGGRRLGRIGATTFAAAALAVGIVAAPAHADRPEPFAFTDSFTEPDPCNPAKMMTTTLSVEGTVHEHRNNVVERLVIHASTSNGYSGTGHLTLVETPRTLTISQQVMVSNPETGHRYKVGGVLVATPKGVRFVNGDENGPSVRCVR